MKEIKKMERTARLLDRIFRVISTVLDIVLIACLVGLGMMAVALIFNLEAGQIGMFSSSVRLGFVDLKFVEGYSPDLRSAMLAALGEVVLVLLFAAAGRIAVKYIREILRPMMQGGPFEGIVSGKVNQLASLSLVLGLAAEVFRMIDQLVLTHVIDFETLLMSGKLEGISFNYELDLTFLIGYAVLKLLSYVFRYGEELQRQSDETL